ncbi:MAG: hypothetical protein NC489_29600 [Ruminococcus flavefaciens]|nr:hypothetical protein [Ruminococcus flavefaciens]
MSSSISIVWGACWLNETIEELVKFFKGAVCVFSSLGIEVYPVVFDAKYHRDSDELIALSSQVKGIFIIQNEINIFPNKNYGIATISQYAYNINSKFVAVVDPDWCVEEYSAFIHSVISPLYYGDADIVIPDIGFAAGRSNLLIGKSALELFYPEYSDIVKTAFPGSLVGLTNKIYEIISSPFYHFDWGGEWDIFSEAVRCQMKIASPSVSVVNLRHRSNESKMQDAFQIWKAVFANEDIVNRYTNVIGYHRKYTPYDRLTEMIYEGHLSVFEQITEISNLPDNATRNQLLYMILYPLASILYEIELLPDTNQTSTFPYMKAEIGSIAAIAPYCVKSALLCSAKSINVIQKRAKMVVGNLWSDWNQSLQKDAIINIQNKFKGQISI